jgi:RecA-family ATPase
MSDQWDDMAGAAMGEDGHDQTKIDARYLDLTSRLLDLEQLRKRPKPTWLVDGYLVSHGLAWLQGKWGNGKSFVAVDIGCCVSTGKPWHGHEVEQGRVLYVIAEGASGLSSRVDAWATEYGEEPDQIKFLPVPVNLMDDEVDVPAMQQLLEDTHPVLVIVDTQARVTVGADENSSRDMGRFVHHLGLLMESSDAALLIVHHEPRNGENMRGSTALEGAALTALTDSHSPGPSTLISHPLSGTRGESERGREQLEHLSVFDQLEGSAPAPSASSGR